MIDLIQLRWFTKPVTRDVFKSGKDGEVIEEKLTKIEKTLQYRVRPDDDSEYSNWMDITEDFHDESPKGSY